MHACHVTCVLYAAAHVSYWEIPYRSGLQRGAARRSSYPTGLGGRESLMRCWLPACSESSRLAGDRLNRSSRGWWVDSGTVSGPVR
jgi:hypothetical protein